MADVDIVRGIRIGTMLASGYVPDHCHVYLLYPRINWDVYPRFDDVPPPAYFVR
jgi:hypothetical protein